MKNKQDPSDGFLVQQFRRGDSTGLHLLVKRYHRIFCERAFWITKDKAIAKDIAQESWLKIMDKLHTLKEAERFKSWALRIVYTKSIDNLKNQNRNRVQIKTVEKFGIEVQQNTDDPNQIHLELLQSINKLSKEKQDIIRLFYTEEYSLKEISSFLRIPVGTVKSRLFKAREKLKTILKNRL